MWPTFVGRDNNSLLFFAPHFLPGILTVISRAEKTVCYGSAAPAKGARRGFARYAHYCGQPLVRQRIPRQASARALARDAGSRCRTLGTRYVTFCRSPYEKVDRSAVHFGPQRLAQIQHVDLDPFLAVRIAHQVPPDFEPCIRKPKVIGADGNRRFQTEAFGMRANNLA